MDIVVTRSDVALWHCDCGHINVDGSTCEQCGATPPYVADHRPPEMTPVRALWEQAHAADDICLAERLAALKAPCSPVPVARIDAAWEAARTPVVGDIRRETTRTVFGIIGLNLLMQIAIIILSVATKIDERQAVELSLGCALMFYGAIAAWVGQRALLLGVETVWARTAPLRGIVEGALLGAGAAAALSIVARVVAGHAVVDPVASALADQGQTTLLLGLLIVVGLAPLVEEIVFRGFLAESFQSRGRRWATVMSALAFALAHLHIVELPYYGLLGLGLAFLYRRHGLIGSITAHAAFNGVLVVFALLALHGPPHT